MDIQPDDDNERRAFLKTCGCTLAGIALAAISGCEMSLVSLPGSSSTTVDIDVSSLVADGTGLKVRAGTAGTILVIRTAPGTFNAMSALCPHTGSFNVSLPENGRMTCPGHESHFDLSGVAIDGDAVPYGGLKKYASTYDASREILTVTVAS